MLIKEPVLNPFHIEISNGNHTVLKNNDKVDKKGEPIYETIGYFSSLPSCLKKIAKEKIIENNKEVSLMLRDYIQQYNEITELITNIFKN